MQVMGVNQLLVETNGHLPETLMEPRTTFRLVILQPIFLENLTMNSMDTQVGQIHQVKNGLLFVHYLLMKVRAPHKEMKRAMIPPNALKMETLTTTAVLLKEQQHARTITSLLTLRLSAMMVETGKPTITNVYIQLMKVGAPSHVKMDQSTSGASKTILVLTGKETLKLRWLVV